MDMDMSMNMDMNNEEFKNSYNEVVRVFADVLTDKEILSSMGQCELRIRESLDNLHDKNNILVLECLLDKLLMLWDLVHRHYKEQLSDTDLKNFIGMNLYHYMTELNDIGSKVTFSTTIEKKYEMFTKQEKFYEVPISREEEETKMKDFCINLCKAELVSLLLICFDFLTTDNKIISLMISDSLRNDIVNKIFGHSNYMLKEIQACFREILRSDLTIKSGTGLTYEKAIMETIDGIYDIISAKGRAKISNMQSRLNLQ